VSSLTLGRMILTLRVWIPHAREREGGARTNGRNPHSFPADAGPNATGVVSVSASEASTFTVRPACPQSVL
jgi:hypothetical protein